MKYLKPLITVCLTRYDFDNYTQERKRSLRPHTTIFQMKKPKSIKVKRLGPGC